MGGIGAEHPDDSVHRLRAVGLLLDSDADPQVRGEIILLVVVVALWRTVRIWWPVVGLTETGRAHRLGQSFWLLLLPVVIYAYLLFGAVGFLRGDTTAVFDVGGAMLSLFAVALRNAWRLVVNVEREGG